MTIADQLGIELVRPSVVSMADALGIEIARVRLKRNRWRGYGVSIGPARNFAGPVRRMNVALGYAEYAIQCGDRRLIEEALRDLVSFHDDD